MGSIILEMLQTSTLPLCASAPDCIHTGEVICRAIKCAEESEARSFGTVGRDTISNSTRDCNPRSH